MKVPEGMLKKGKLELLPANIARSGDTDSDGECDSSSDGDDDLQEKESDSNDSSGDDIGSLFHATRFGRTARTWKKQFFQYFFCNIQYCIQIEINVANMLVIPN